MRKKNLVICCLWLLIAALGNTAFATEPYASIVVYNENIGNSNSDGHPNISPLGTLDIINMTPWDISFSKKPVFNSTSTVILQGMTTSTLMPFWLQGINTAFVTDPKAYVNPAFAFHSVQIPLVDLNGVWPLDTSLQGPGEYNTDSMDPFGGTTNLGTMQIVINSQTSSTSGKTAALNFSVLSTAGFTRTDDVDNKTPNAYPATALSFGDGTKNYGWRSNDTFVEKRPLMSKNKTNTTQFFTIQALPGGDKWKPITNNLVGSVANKGTGGSAPGTTVQSPEFLTASGLAYRNFSSVAGITAVPGQSYDLVVLLQAGGYVDSALIFLAVPSANNALLNGVQ